MAESKTTYSYLQNSAEYADNESFAINGAIISFCSAAVFSSLELILKPAVLFAFLTGVALLFAIYFICRVFTNTHNASSRQHTSTQDNFLDEYPYVKEMLE